MANTAPVPVAASVWQLKIADIVRDPTLQPRERINQTTVVDYAEELKNGAIFPAVIVFRITAKDYLTVGWHRLLAHVEAKRRFIDAEVRAGTFQDAIACAAGDNAKHGLPRTNGDKRRAVRMFLIDDVLRRLPDGEIAAACHVHRTSVLQWRREYTAEIAESASCRNRQDAPGEESPAAAGSPPQATRTVTRGGKTFSMDVTKLQAKEQAAIARRQQEDIATAHARIAKSLIRLREELEELEPERRAWDFEHPDGPGMGWVLKTRGRWASIKRLKDAA